VDKCEVENPAIQPMKRKHQTKDDEHHKETQKIEKSNHFSSKTFRQIVPLHQ
jgi:hypothetical protein